MSTRNGLTLLYCALLCALLAACSSTPAPPTATLAPPPTPTIMPATATPVPTPTPGPAGYPLAEPGPYAVGLRTLVFVDDARAGRTLRVTLWYPAVRPGDAADTRPARDAEPAREGAPYPLMVMSAKSGGIFGPHLASHGFVVSGDIGMDSTDRWRTSLIDFPLDLLFELDQLAEHPPAGFDGVIDATRAGALGYSFDGYNSLALSGARVDPAYYLAQCAAADSMEPAPPPWWVTYICEMAGDWDGFVAHAGATLTAGDDGMWRPMTDERIRAVMPMAPEGAWLFGPRGLAAADRPTLLIGATEDDSCLYDLEATFILEHLGGPAPAMISFIGEGHGMIFNATPVAKMRHLATTFFGYHLQGREEYAAYYSEEFVATHDELAWGVYAGQQ